MYRQKYCELFSTTEQQLWPRPGPGSGLTSSNAVGERPPLLIPALTAARPPPEYADHVHLASVREHIREIVTLDNRFGGADLVRLSARFFRTLHDHIGAGNYDSRLEHDLQAAAGELAEVVGWLAYDAEEHDLVRRMNQESLYFTRLAGDRTMELLTLQNASMHAGALGRPREALQIANSVLEGGYRLSPRLRALFLTRKARALAQGGDEGALCLFGEVKSLFLEGVGNNDPAWAWWVDERELAWHEAMAQRDLGHSGRAITEFEHSVAATAASEIRSQYLHKSYLLKAQVELRSWADAEVTIRDLLPLVGQVASTRTVVLLRGTLALLASMSGKIPSGILDQSAILDSALKAAPL
jgi:hypothetical protein